MFGAMPTKKAQRLTHKQLCAFFLLALLSLPLSAGDKLDISVRGSDFNWFIAYPGPDGQLGTEDDVTGQRNLYVPANHNIVLHLASDDYIYSLSLPHWDKVQMAVPELDFKLEFASGQPGEWPLKGNQMCGYSHKNLLGKVFVMAPQAWLEWLESRGEK